MNEDYKIQKIDDDKILLTESVSKEFSKKELEAKLYEVNQSLIQLEQEYLKNKEQWEKVKARLEDALNTLTQQAKENVL